MSIRPRRNNDVAALCDLVRVVHASDGYPTLLQDDVGSFLLTDNCLGAWVGDVDGRLVGHVALHTIWSDEVAGLAASSLRRTRESLVSLSRLFVDPQYRRRGLGLQLVGFAVREAHNRELWPVLDVVTTYAPAIALYEHAGWARLGTISLPMPDGRLVQEHVYAAPPRSA